MLVLGRYENERIVIDGPCEIVVVEVGRGKVRLGIEAGPEVKILRKELGPDDGRLPAKGE